MTLSNTITGSPLLLDQRNLMQPALKSMDAVRANLQQPSFTSSAIPSSSAPITCFPYRELTLIWNWKMI
jgi:hypothetical protein